MEQFIYYKRINADSGAIKDIDTKQGRVLGYFSVFGNVDSDGDMIMPGAYKKTIAENYPRIKHLYQHDPWRPLSGTKNNMLKVSEDAKGLLFDSTISQTSWGKDTIRLYADGVLDEHSVGILPVRTASRKNHQEINEVKLFEGSSVTWGSNPLAVTDTVKSLTKETLLNRTERIMKSIRNGRYENEEIFDMLELYLKQLQQLFIDLTEKKPKDQPQQKRVRNWEALPKLLTT